MFCHPNCVESGGEQETSSTSEETGGRSYGGGKKNRERGINGGKEKTRRVRDMEEGGRRRSEHGCHGVK